MPEKLHSLNQSAAIKDGRKPSKFALKSFGKYI